MDRARLALQKSYWQKSRIKECDRKEIRDRIIRAVVHSCAGNPKFPFAAKGEPIQHHPFPITLFS
jgi:hypothetical protein